MSEPITLTERPELDALIAAAVAVAEAMSPEERAAMMEAQRQSWVRGEQGLRRPTESASPPRVPGANAQPLKVGVESGPGQPIDICERMNRARDYEPNAELRMILAEGEMEIRRLREQVKAERRAGIEAALRIIRHPNAGLEPPDGGSPTPQQMLDNIIAEISALADKPAPDARKGG